MTYRRKLALALGCGLLAASVSIASAWQASGSADHGRAQRTAALDATARALGAGDVAAAQRAWREAHRLALDSDDWQGLVETADAYLKVAHRSGLRRDDAFARARQIYLAALMRARAQRSVEGVLRAAEGLALIGDRDAAAMAVHLAHAIALAPPETAANTSAGHLPR